MEWSCCFVTARPLRVRCLYYMLAMCCVCLTIVNGNIVVDNKSGSKVTAHVGDTVTLVCDLRNVDEDDAIYWYALKFADTISRNRDITQDKLRDRYSIVGNVTQEEFNIKITDVQTSDADTYDCVYYDYVIRKNELVSTDLIVLEPPSEDSPRCIVYPKYGTSTDFSVHDRVIIECNTEGGSPPPDLRWILNNGVLSTGTGTLQKELTLWSYLYNEVFTCLMRTDALNATRNCTVVPLKSTTTTPSRYKKTSTLSPSSKTNDPQVTTQVKHTGLSGRTQTAIDDKDPMMQNIILIGAAGGGGLLLLVLLVSIIIAIICCWRKKRTKGVVSTPANRPATGEYEMVNPQPESSNQSITVIAKENSYVTVDSPSKDPGRQSPDGESPVYALPGTKDDSRRNTGAGGGGETEGYKLVYADLDLNDATDVIIQTDEPTEYVKIKV